MNVAHSAGSQCRLMVIILRHNALPRLKSRRHSGMRWYETSCVAEVANVEGNSS
jgi:hypothetical protein